MNQKPLHSSQKQVRQNCEPLRSNRLHIKDMLYVSLFGAVIAVCAFISIPFVVPFTLQLFAVFCAAALLGTRRAVLSVLLYILLGAAGLPVFSGFRGGFGVLFGATGGFVIGFVFCALTEGLMVSRLGHGIPALIFSMLAGLFVCYAFGTLQYAYVALGHLDKGGLRAAFGVSVLPFIVPDILKLFLAAAISSRLYHRHIL